MADLFESIVEQIASKTMSGLITKERQRDISLIGKSWDFYNGDQEGYIRKYRGEDEDDYKDKDKPTFNYTKLIIDEYVAGVFGKPVQVEFNEEADSDRWGDITKPITFVGQVPFMKKVQRISEISETAAVMVRYDESREMPFFEDIRGEFLTFLPKDNNPKEIGVLVISYIYDTGIPDPSQRFMERIEIWDEERWEIWVNSPTMKRKEKIAGDDNPYGIIPVSLFRPDEDDNSFYGKGACRDLVTINEVYNNLWTALTRISTFQSFSILVIQSENEIKVEVAPTRYLKLPETDKAEVKYVTPSAKIEEVRKVLMSLKEDLQDFSRVPSSVFSSQGSKGAPQSGYALKIKRIPIEEVWENRRVSYGPAYANLAAMTMHIDAIHKGSNPGDKYLVDGLPTVEFSSTVPGLSPQEQLIQDQFDLRYNIITPVDIVLRAKPGLTRDEALEELLRNKEENMKLGVTAAGIVDVTGQSAALENILAGEREQEQNKNKDDTDIKTPTPPPATDKSEE
jgi:hypothetical protein